jgi:hypothetical protein
MYVSLYVCMYVCMHICICMFIYNTHIHSKHKWLPSNHYHHHEPFTSLPFGCYDLLSAFVVSPRISPIWLLRCELGSSVSIVSGYRLDDRAIEVRSHAEEKGFFLYPLCPDRLWGPPSLLYNGYRGPFPGGKEWPGRDADHSPLCSAEVENE